MTLELHNSFLCCMCATTLNTAPPLPPPLSNSFPMGFVSDRLYAGISRREFSDPSQPGCLWGVTKVVHTPVSAAWAALNYPGGSDS